MNIVVAPVEESADDDNTWKSCGNCTVDKRSTVFFSQLTIAITVIIFCIAQLSLSDSCEKDSLYSGILMLVVGVYLPSPQIDR